MSNLLSPRQSLQLPSGRAIEVETRGAADLLRVRAKNGACVLTVSITNEGPVLRFESASIELAATRSIEVSCEELRIDAGDIALRARSIEVEATQGAVKVRASDDVSLDGERVLLNSTDGPKQLTWDDYFARFGNSESVASSSKRALDDTSNGEGEIL